MDYSNHSELSVPFIAVALSTLHGTNEDTKAPSSSDDRPTQKNEAEQQPMMATSGTGSGPISLCDHVTNLALYALLLVQFGTFFYYNDDAVSEMNWTVVNISITLFMVSTHLYRCVMNEIGVSDARAMLFPELAIVISMLLAYLQHVMPAFLLLTACQFCMALAGATVNGYRLYHFNENVPAENSPDKSHEDSVV
jgi:hypothetical protein